MKHIIIPLGAKIQLDIEENSAGSLDIASVPTAIESGKVIALGKDVTLSINIGDMLFFKSWAVDIITHDGKRYYFIDEDTKGICAIVKK